MSDDTEMEVDPPSNETVEEEPSKENENEVRIYYLGNNFQWFLKRFNVQTSNLRHRQKSQRILTMNGRTKMETSTLMALSYHLPHRRL